MQVLLPLKEFAAAKQRLAGVLSAVERAQLFQAMVEDVLAVLTCHPQIERVAICSRDRAACWLAHYYGAEFIDEATLPANDLNSAVNAACAELFARDTNDLLVVHGDLPLLGTADLDIFLQAHRRSSRPAVTIAPDRYGAGTNLLAWRALPEFVARYGENSFRRHCEQARALHVEPAICDLPGARCDIDDPDDLFRLLASPLQRDAVKTLAFLYDSGVADRLLAMQCGAAAAQTGGGREHA